MENEIIKVDQEQVAEVTKKVVFTKGEKTALVGFTIGAAMLGYAAGKVIVEPVVKKAASGIGGLIKGIVTKSEDNKGKEAKKDDQVNDIPEVEAEVEVV